MKRSLSIFILSVQLGASAEQFLDHFYMAMPRCYVKRS